ncbi:hypothetical protein J437_LFUL003175 [Ladona fulva]|uniref:Uncharacterized protein n=1 Tax=Ladona fulva TaxID=123851 RepID=A0A8K0NWP2_LADFU|nr:hypothetical protein J437_LFUL003175 [Ladona fulva]
MILTITRLTKDTALRDIPHQYISPPISITIAAMVITTTTEEAKSNPIRTKVTKKMAAKEIPRLFNVSGHIWCIDRLEKPVQESFRSMSIRNRHLRWGFGSTQEAADIKPKKNIPKKKQQISEREVRSIDGPTCPNVRPMCSS